MIFPLNTKHPFNKFLLQNDCETKFSVALHSNVRLLFFKCNAYAKLNDLF